MIGIITKCKLKLIVHQSDSVKSFLYYLIKDPRIKPLTSQIFNTVIRQELVSISFATFCYVTSCYAVYDPYVYGPARPLSRIYLQDHLLGLILFF